MTRSIAARASSNTAGRRSLTGLVAVIVASIAASVAASIGGGTTVSAHDDIAGSTPADRSVIDEPISSAEIDFGEVIGDSVEMFLTYDPGGGEAIVDLGGDTTKTSDTTARLDFAEIEDEGTYFLQYLAPVPADGHVMVGAISFTFGEPTAIDQGDNADIRSSTPTSRARIDEPISSAEIEFDLEITDDVTLGLVYDRGDGENFDELDGVTEKTGPRTATLTFDEIEREGTYFVTYDAVALVTGDELVGATSFTFGDPSSAESSFPILPFLAVAAPILLIGAWFTYRRMLVTDHPHDDDPTTRDPSPDPATDDGSTNPAGHEPATSDPASI